MDRPNIIRLFSRKMKKNPALEVTLSQLEDSRHDLKILTLVYCYCVAGKQILKVWCQLMHCSMIYYGSLRSPGAAKRPYLIGIFLNGTVSQEYHEFYCSRHDLKILPLVY